MATQETGNTLASSSESVRKVIEVRISELDQLFNSMDPSPFQAKKLDDDAEEYIVSMARELHVEPQLTLVVHLDRPMGLPNEDEILGQAIQDHFSRRCQHAGRNLRQVLRRQWFNLAIGLSLLAASVVFGEIVARYFGMGPLATVIRESLLIGGWVALWQPMEFFFYDLWETKNLIHHYHRLSLVTVQIVYSQRDAERSATGPSLTAAQATVIQSQPDLPNRLLTRVNHR